MAGFFRAAVPRAMAHVPIAAVGRAAVLQFVLRCGQPLCRITRCLTVQPEVGFWCPCVFIGLLCMIRLSVDGMLGTGRIAPAPVGGRYRCGARAFWCASGRCCLILPSRSQSSGHCFFDVSSLRPLASHPAVYGGVFEPTLDACVMPCLCCIYSWLGSCWWWPHVVPARLALTRCTGCANRLAESPRCVRGSMQTSLTCVCSSHTA
jgi:hypothetical protein